MNAPAAPDITIRIRPLTGGGYSLNVSARTPTGGGNVSHECFTTWDAVALAARDWLATACEVTP